MTQRDLPGQIPRQTGPIFIGGAGRSGTTLMRALLDAHPRICCGPELKALPEISGLYRSFAAASSPVQQAYGNTLADIRSYFQEFIERLVGKYRRASGKPRWGEKTPHNLLCMLMLGEIFPDARFIHMIRDGRDVACSLVKMDWTDAGTGQKLGYCQNIRNAARYWRDLVRFGQPQAAHPTLAGRMLTVPYELLVAKPDETMRQTLQFMGESWHPEIMSYWQKDRRNEPAESSSAQITRPVYSSAVGRWRIEMTPADRAAFETEAGDLLRELNYARDCWIRE